MRERPFIERDSLAEASGLFEKLAVQVDLETLSVGQCRHDASLVESIPVLYAGSAGGC
jgi:hypothetical protein